MKKLSILILLLFHFLDSTGQTKADTLNFVNQTQNLKDSLLKTLAKENYAIERKDSGSYHFENYRLNSTVIVQFTIEHCYSIDQSTFPNYSELIRRQDFRKYLTSNKCDSTITFFSKEGKIIYNEKWSFITFEVYDVPEQGLNITGRDNKATLHYRIR